MRSFFYAVVLAVAGFGTGRASGQGTALQFDGVDDEVFVPADASLHPTQLTVEAWVYVESYAGGSGMRMIVNSETSDGYGIGIDAAGNLFMAAAVTRPTEGANWTDCFAVIPEQQWTHVSMVLGGTTTLIYVNGAITRQFPSSPLASFRITPVYIGGDPQVGRWSGVIDDVRIWAAARAPQEIDCTLTGDEVDLRAYWSFDSCNGQVVFDQSPLGNDGTLGTDPINSDPNDPMWINSTAPIVCGPSIAIPTLLTSNPPGGWIDPLDNTSGIDEVTLTFDRPTTLSNIVLTTTDSPFIPGVPVAPAVTSVDEQGNTVTICLDRPIPAGEWTTLTADAAPAGCAIPLWVSVTIGHLPCDINGDQNVGLADATAFINEWNGSRDPTLIDINRDGDVGLADVSAFVDLFRGNNGGMAWNGHFLP